MRSRKCPYCNRSYWDWESSLTGKRPASPTLVCPKCHKSYPDLSFQEIALKPYQPPRKREVLLCGLWPFGILGMIAIFIGMLLNQLWVVILGGLSFSFWILLIAMSLCLWNEVCANAQKAYNESLARLKAQHSPE